MTTLTQDHLDRIAECESKINEAEAAGKLLAVNQGSIMVAWTPAALRRQQAEGKFCWSPYNFFLMDPNDPTLEHYGRYN